MRVEQLSKETPPSFRTFQPQPMNRFPWFVWVKNVHWNMVVYFRNNFLCIYSTLKYRVFLIFKRLQLTNGQKYLSWTVLQKRLKAHSSSENHRFHWSLYRSTYIVYIEKVKNLVKKSYLCTNRNRWHIGSDLIYIIIPLYTSLPSRYILYRIWI